MVRPAPVSKENPVTLPPLVEPAESLTKAEVERYSRHLIIPDVGMTGQKRMKNAKVLVVGAGGLGSPALLYLAAAGVGTLGILDFDTVDESNLQRQVIHGQSDIGKSKAVSAAESIAEINPYVTVNLHTERLDSGNALEIFEPYDLILDGTDNFATRYLVNDACVLLGKPYVWGSIYRFEGQASLFWAQPTGGTQEGVQYRDLYPEPPPPGMVPSCAEGGVLGVLCASIGSIMVTEAIKLITGIGDPLIGRLIDYEAFCGAMTDEAAAAVAGHTIGVAQLEEWLQAREAGERDFVLIDVRESVERDINEIPGSVLIPKGDFLNGSALPELPQDKQVVLYCKAGTRSAECLAIVHGAGLADAVHVGGGVSAWVSQIDPSQPAY